MKPYVKEVRKGEWWDDMDRTKKGRRLAAKSRRMQLKSQLKREVEGTTRTPKGKKRK